MIVLLDAHVSVMFFSWLPILMCMPVVSMHKFRACRFALSFGVVLLLFSFTLTFPMPFVRELDGSMVVTCQDVAASMCGNGCS